MRETHGPKGEMDADEMLACIGASGLRGHDLRVYLRLKKICEGFCWGYDVAMTEAHRDVGRLGRDGGKTTPALRPYIVDMVKTGLDENLALAILDRVYIQNGMYEELFDACHEMLEFVGFAKDRMMGSTLVELAIHRMIHRLSAGKKGKKNRDKLVAKCVDLLQRRACALGIDISAHCEETDPLYRADLISMDVYARRGFEPTQRIAQHLHLYPCTCRFLGLTEDKILSLVRTKKSLAYYASVAIHAREAAPRHETLRPGALDVLEWMLQAMEGRGINIGDCQYGTWRDGLCGMKLSQSLFEMRLYLHFLPVDKDLELEPHIDNCKKADFGVLGLFVEAFAPHEKTHTAFGHMQLAGSRDGLAHSICTKSQIDSFGRRPSIMVLEDPHNYVNDAAFHEMLARKIRPHAQLGGVLIARDVGTHYRCKLVKNPGAVSGITPEMERMVTQALGTPYCQ